MTLSQRPWQERAWSWRDHTGIQDPSAPQAGKLGLLALRRAEEPSPAGPDACLACLAPTGFAVGWGPIPWLLMSEIFPLHVKGVATGMCVLTNWLMAFLVTKEFSSLMEVLRPYGAFWLASAFCIFSVLFTLFCVPETKGKTLEQITAHFEGR